MRKLLLAALLLAPACSSATHHTTTTEDNAPACFAEPSETPEGVEIIFYPHLSMHDNFKGVLLPDAACKVMERTYR
jgi:hypothetical protein